MSLWLPIHGLNDKEKKNEYPLLPIEQMRCHLTKIFIFIRFMKDLNVINDYRLHK